MALTQPSIFIFSSTDCLPCTLLKKWLEKEYPQEDINILLVENIALRSITDDIYILPTIVYYQDGKVSIQIEDFDKTLIRDMIQKKKNHIEKTQKKEEKQDLKPVDVDQILKALHYKLQYL
jgi:hypothetical protein